MHTGCSASAGPLAPGTSSLSTNKRFFSADGALNEDTMEYALGFCRGYVAFTPGA